MQPWAPGSVRTAQPKALSVLGEGIHQARISSWVYPRWPGPPQLESDEVPRRPLLNLANCLNFTVAHRLDHGKARWSYLSLRALSILSSEGFLSSYSVCSSGVWIHFSLRRVGSAYGFRRCLVYPAKHGLAIWVGPEDGNRLLLLRNSFCLLSVPGAGLMSLAEARHLRVPGCLLLQVLL